MPTPRKGYYTDAGKRVPGVTTIIGRFKDSGGLIHWANTLAYEPYRELRSVVEQLVSNGVDTSIIDKCKTLLEKPADAADYRVARDTAATVGTIVHARVDAFARRREFDPKEFISAEFPDTESVMLGSETGFGAFQEWAGSSSFKLEEGEMQLVSNQHRFGGTPDVIMVRGEKTVGDWKTGDLYPSQLLPQLAAYRYLLIEHGRSLGGGAHAISINKKTGGFTHRYFTPDEVANGWQAFQLMAKLYELIKLMK